MDSNMDIKNPQEIGFTIYSKSGCPNCTRIKKTFTEMSNTKYETEYYPSGRVMYVGEVLYKKKDELVTRIPNGVGTLYYDIDDYKIKYMVKINKDY